VPLVDFPETPPRLVQVASTVKSPSGTKVTPAKVALPVMAMAVAVVTVMGALTCVTVSVTVCPSSMSVITSKAAW
jgi:hypothetical protein